MAAAAFTGGAITTAAKTGKLGATLTTIATKLENLTHRLGTQIDNLITNPSLRHMIDRLADNTGAIRFPGDVPALPMGVSRMQFDEMSELIAEATRHIHAEPRIHGSRVSRTATANSDIDIALLVDDAEFDRLLEESFGIPNPGSSRERSLEHAMTVGKIDSGEAGLRAVHRKLKELLGLKVDISIIRRGGPFDRGPYLPIPGGTQ